VVDAARGSKVAAGEVFIPICCERLTVPDDGRAFAELLAALLVKCPENVALLSLDPVSGGPTKEM
jgi:hypothetical protein